MVSLTYLPQKHKFKVFIFLLDETEMAQNNSLFVWKISNYSWGRSNLRNDLNQVTSRITGFYMGKNSKFTGSFSWGCFMWHRLQCFLWCCFWSPYFFNCLFCGRPCCKTSIPAPTLRSSLLSLFSLHLLYWGTVFLILV